jgi:hypothetical protein
LLLSLVSAWLGAPGEARACGGTFCDGTPGQAPMPVDQTGENILFIRDGAAIEAHIQIQYTGEPQRFAWVVPIPSVPQFRVGSDLLFQELLRATAPAYVTQALPPDVCAESMLPYLLAAPALLLLPLAPLLWLPAIFFAQGCAMQGAGLNTLGDPAAQGDTRVVFRDSVGAFDITVLQASNADEVLGWLAANNYTIPPAAGAVLRQYSEENSLFAAIKLVSNARVDQIHPIVLRYEHGVPCIPLRLTALAATANMGVRAFFLGNGRTVPRTYRHVLVNPARVDWLNKGANYMDVIAHAVDDDQAQGQAFVTEYAGRSAVVLPNNVRWWTLTGTAAGATMQGVVEQLTGAGLMACGSGNLASPPGVTGTTPPNSCTFFHPLLHGLLQDFLSPPAGLTELEYWRNLATHLTQEQSDRWDPLPFAQEFDERISSPATNATALLGNNPYLTRLFTTISPDEMTVDPEFHERTDLPPVGNVQLASTQQHCDGVTTVSLPDGRTVNVGNNLQWPTFSNRMPWTLRVEDIPVQGGTTTLADRGAEVDAQLKVSNDALRPMTARTSRCACSVPVAGVPWLGVLGLLFLRRWRRR